MLLKMPQPSKSDDWVQISADHITKLDGFTNANLGLIFGDLLEQMVTLTPREELKLEVVQYGDERVGNKRHFDDALNPWAAANAIVCINKTIARLQDRLGVPPKTYGLVTQHWDHRRPEPIGQIPGQKKYVHVNWLIAFPCEWRPEGVDLVGQMKDPRHFDPTGVVFINPADEDAWEEPPPEIAAANWCLRQCGTYAWQAECRYMFLVTVEYVTVLRFHLVEEGEDVPSTATSSRAGGCCP